MQETRKMGLFVLLYFAYLDDKETDKFSWKDIHFCQAQVQVNSRSFYSQYKFILFSPGAGANTKFRLVYIYTHLVQNQT